MWSRSAFVLSSLFVTNISGPVFAAPDDTIFSDDFEGDFGNWQFTSSPGSESPGGIAGVNTMIANSGSQSMFVAGGPARVFLQTALDLESVPAVSLQVWLRRGQNTFSNAPEDTDDLVIEFLASDGSWQEIQRFEGGWPPGAVFTPTLTLPPAALHSGFRIGFRLTDGQTNIYSGNVFDYWHIDDLLLFEPVTPGLGGICWDFSSDEGAFTGAVPAARGGIGDATFQSAPSSLFLQGGRVRNSTDDPETTGKDVRVKVWVRRGSDDFSEAPDAGEDLTLVYYGSNGQYNLLERFPGAGSPGEIFIREYHLPANAAHDNFSLRLQLEDADETNGDYWHVDDVCVLTSNPVDHFSISHSGTAVNCQAEPVRITAHTADHNLAPGFTGTVSLSTDTANGDWSLASGNGSLVNSGSGIANYQFAAADNGEVLLALRDTQVEVVDIDVRSGSVAEAPGEDPSLAFAATGFRFVTAGTSNPVGFQLAGKPSTEAPANPIELQAIRSSDSTGACEAAFVGATTVELAASCENPGSCSGASALVNGSSIATAASGPPPSWTAIDLDFGDDTDSTAALPFRYDDAGALQLHARKLLAVPATMMSGSSNTFTVRPFGLEITADQGSITASNPAAVDSSGTAFARAGEAFRVSLRAVGWQAADDIDADGIPDGHDDDNPTSNADLSDNITLPNFGAELAPDSVTVSSRLVAPTGGNAPPLAGTTSVTGFTAGAASSSDMRWQEGGIIELASELADGDYLGTGNIRARSGHVGRFAAHHLDTRINHHGCDDIAGFGWSGQPIAEMEVNAYTENGAVLQNYDWDAGTGDGFARDISLADVAAIPPGTFSSGISRMDFVNGTTTQVASIAYTFATTPNEPWDLVIRATDTDSATSASSAEALTRIRSGQLRLMTGAATTLRPARSTFHVERWENGEWSVEEDDSCTFAQLSTGGVGMTGFTDNLDTGESLPTSLFLDEGQGWIEFSAPGNGNEGRMDVTLDVPPWLEPGGTDPGAPVIFLDEFAEENGVIERVEIIR